VEIAQLCLRMHLFYVSVFMLGCFDLLISPLSCSGHCLYVSAPSPNHS
jgi:hypothetical protein